MAASAKRSRVAVNAARPLPEAVFDSLREAVVVVDARAPHLPVVLANATARRCLLASDAASLVDHSLHALLGGAADAAIDAVLGPSVAGKPVVNRVLAWALPRGATPLSTEIKLLAGRREQRLVMMTFAEATVESDAKTATEAPAPVSSEVERLPRDLVILDDRLSVTYANTSAVRTAGAGVPEGILGYSALTLVPMMAIPREVFERALAGSHFHCDAIAVLIPGGATRWFEVDVQPLPQASGIAGVAVLSSEVTNRRSRRFVPAHRARRFVPSTEATRDIITIAGRDGRLSSGTVFDRIHPDDVDGLRIKFRQLVEGVIGPFSQQVRLCHTDGGYRWLESHYESALDNPLINGVVIHSRDVTLRRQAETQLAQREQSFRLAADAVNAIIFEWDVAGAARIHPQDELAYARTVAEAFDKERGWTTTYRIRDVRGRYRSLLERTLIQRNEAGEPLRAIGCCVDVSEIKRLTDLLAETQSAAKMGGWEYSYATQSLMWTEEMFRIYETTPQDFVLSLDAVLGQFTPESRLRLERAFAEGARTGGTFDLELEIMTRQHRRLWIRLIGHVETVDRRPLRAFGSVQNIQAQKLAQIALENSTGWLKLSMNMAKMHAWRWDRASDSLEFAGLDGRMKHLPRVFPGMKQLMARMHPRDRVAARRAIDTAFATRTEVQSEFRLRSKSGRFRCYAAVARPLFDAAEKPCGLVGVTQDVTARHESEARLRRSEELLRTTTANSADTLMLVDTDLCIRFINRGELGMSIEEIIGQSIAVLLPKSARERILAKLRRVLATAEPVTYEFDVKGVGAETQYLENRAVLVSDDGIGTGISITVRNITERKRLEREILDVSSRERQSIGRDLHDGLGQELTGVALMLRGLATRIEKQLPPSVAQVNEIVGLVNQSIETARSLARGLLPVSTDNGGLPAALRTLADRSRDFYRLPVNFRSDVTTEVPLSEACASHLYRIAQEALTNAARHGCASAVDVLLRVSPLNFLLEIVDNGIGTGAGCRSTSGMGLKIMKYRASMIGARFEILPNRPCGTLVRVSGEQPLLFTGLQSAHSI
jgi:PAS domain S-box-containing protein